MKGDRKRDRKEIRTGEKKRRKRIASHASYYRYIT